MSRPNQLLVLPVAGPMSVMYIRASQISVIEPHMLEGVESGSAIYSLGDSGPAYTTMSAEDVVQLVEEVLAEPAPTPKDWDATVAKLQARIKDNMERIEKKLNRPETL